MIVASLRSLRGGFAVDEFFVKINTSTSNLTGRSLFGNGSSTSSYAVTSGAFAYGPAATATASTFGNFSLYFPNYAGSTNKSYSTDGVGENNATEANQVITAGLWSQTTAINAIALYASSGNLAEYSSATLYGITKGSSGGVVVS
jgi:hypothetical protein